LTGALAQITDSGPTKPYVVKLRTDGTTQLNGGLINKSYVWIQGDGASRIGALNICADGVRVTGVISTGISVANQAGCSLTDDPTDVYIADNIIYEPSTGTCGTWWTIGRTGTGRLNTITFANNEVGRITASTGDGCDVRLQAASPGAGRTHIHFIGNVWYDPQPIHGSQHINTLGTAPNVIVWSTGNTFIGNIRAGVSDPGEFFSCFEVEDGMSITSSSDTCILFRSDNTSDDEEFLFFQVDTDYSESVVRRITLINPTLEVILPATESGDDTIGLFNIDTPSVDLRIVNPTVRATLGPGFDSATDVYFGIVDGGRSTPPSAANTFIQYSGVVNAPSGTIQERNSPSYVFRPLSHILPDAFDLGIVLNGADLQGICSAGELRFDTGGATRELCVCDPANTWRCVTLGSLVD
jgi:hypothetical protein